MHHGQWYEHEACRNSAILGTECCLSGPFHRHRLFFTAFGHYPPGFTQTKVKFSLPS